MRALSTKLLLLALSAVTLSAQAMTEAAAAAAGGAVGGVAGKKVSDGVSSIFGKLDKQAAAAAGTGAPAKASPAKAAPASSSNAPLIEAGPGTPQAGDGFVPPSAPTAPAKTNAKPKAQAKARTGSGDTLVVPPSAWDDVPPPPPLPGQHPVAAPKPAPRPVVVRAAPVFQAPPPPPPPVTLEDLQKIETGMTRAEVLRLGLPSARITMFDNGGLLEIFSYHTHDPQFGDRSIGIVRLNDGSVSGVQLRD